MLVTRRHFFLGSLALPILADKKPAGARPNLLLFAVDNPPSWIVGSYAQMAAVTPADLQKFGLPWSRGLASNDSTKAPVPGIERLLLA